MAENSPIQAKGVGKNSKRHDLDGTPGLSDGSSLEQGEVQQLEAGQKAVENTQQAQTVTAAPTPRAPLPAQGMNVPDAVTFAGQKVGGDLSDAGQAQLEQHQSKANWLPLLRRLAVSPTSSGILQRAFVERLSVELKRPAGGRAQLVRQRDYDQRLEQFNGNG